MDTIGENSDLRGMGSIHLASPEGTQSIHDEAQARELWSQGAIGAGWLYWREGMNEWRSAEEFFGPGPGQSGAIVTPPTTATLPPRGFAKDPIGLTKALVVILWIYIALAALAAIVQAISIATGQATGSADQLSPLDVVLVLLGLPQFLVFVVTGVVFLMWIYRARKNAEWLGARGMGFTPGWSVGWYFIPILNLWKPYQAMKEICTQSMPADKMVFLNQE